MLGSRRHHMEDVDRRICKKGHEYADREPVEDPLDGVGEPLRVADAGAAGSSRKRASTGAHARGFGSVSFAGAGHGIGYECHGEKEQEEDRITCP